MGVAAQYRAAKRIPTKARAVPRSGCRITNPSGTTTSAEGASRSRRYWGGSSRTASRRASARMVASFANSEGWKRKPAMEIQLFTPAAVPAPVPTTRVAARRISAMTKAGTATHSIQCRGMRVIAAKAISASRSQRTCLIHAPSVTELGTLRTPAE